MTDKFIQITSLFKSYFLGENEIRVLKGIELELERGEIASLTGRSGAGKSTFLHLVGTLDSPDKGSILIDGKDVTGMGHVELTRFRNRTIGFVFQFHHLLPEFTALENVAIPALIARVSKGEAYQRARKLLDRVGLKERYDHKPGELSGGEQQRVAVARALVMEPKLLLADEPTGNLDEVTGSEIHNILLELNQTLGLTMIIATHNTAFAAKMPRKLEIKDGLVYG